MANLTFTDEELKIICKLLTSTAVQNLIGAEEWSLTEDEEETLWEIINRVEKDGV